MKQVTHLLGNSQETGEGCKKKAAKMSIVAVVFFSGFLFFPEELDIRYIGKNAMEVGVLEEFLQSFDGVIGQTVRIRMEGGLCIGDFR
jgi:hypothetical protein